MSSHSFRKRAAANGRSMEEEARQVILAAANDGSTAPRKSIGQMIYEMSRPGFDIPEINLVAFAHGTASCSLAAGLHSETQIRAKRSLPVHANCAIERRRGEPRARTRAELFRLDERLSLHGRPPDDRALQASP
jgi:hypothetical protein